MKTPQEVLQEHLEGINDSYLRAKENKCKDAKEIERVLKTFVCAINFLDVMLQKPITYRSFKIRTPRKAA
jgi:hypothetical protein